MRRASQVRQHSRLLSARSRSIAISLCAFAALLGGCRKETITIAVIPRTCGTILWEAEHTGAARAARLHGWSIYWNAPMREDDNRAQIDILGNAIKHGASGVILAPVEALPLRTPVARAVEHGTPVVVVGTDLGLPPGKHLAYVLNDERMGGQLAARKIGELLHGHGDVAILGIQNQLTSTYERADSLESTLRNEFPHIRVVFRSMALTTIAQEQQVAESLLSTNSSLKAIAALSEASTRGAYYALQEFSPAAHIHIVGFDQNLLVPLRTGDIDAIVMQNTNQMGREAVALIDEEMRSGATRQRVVIPPVLVTRESFNSLEVKNILDLEWYAQ